MNPTNDPKLKSFIEVEADSHFPIQNLPYGVCKSTESGQIFICSAIGDYVVNMKELEAAGLIGFKDVFAGQTLNKFIELGCETWGEIRANLSNLLRADESALRDNASLRDAVFIPRDEVEMLLPVHIGDYTDFYSSEQHARNVGTMFRGAENALKPNWKHLPVGYHGRASSIVVSGTALHRPQGQTIPNGPEQPIFGPCKRLDFELEMGFITGPGNALGDSIPAKSAREHIFGLVLVNDWSARDIQKWEYVPLGPFLAKNWATTISPWIVPLEALEPFQINGPAQNNPTPLPYLQCDQGWYDVNLEVTLKPDDTSQPNLITKTNYKNMYWSMNQQLAHQTITGCNVRAGDLYASGTISGEGKHAYGSLLELSWNGEKPLHLENGEQRTFIEDGDTITLTGYSQGDGYRIGFGEAEGKILPIKKI